ncbi:MAG TPA: glycosyltransferase [Bacteroidetes bacterium]|nr:glycosyltransferase [Bacteroidota bacterium]
MKAVLMISYVFPPVGGSGVQRTLYFTKYLPEFGYRPIVVHGGQRPQGGVQDKSLLKELNPNIIRFQFLPFELACLTVPIAKVFRNLGHIGAGLSWIIEALTNYIERRISPDELLFWALRLVNQIIQLVKRFDVKLIYSTFDPASNHYLAWQVKRRMGLPWVADFRDLWYTKSECPAFRVRRDRHWLKVFLENADAVINVTEYDRKVMMEFVPSVPSGRFHVVRNGVDLNNFPSVRQCRNDRFTLSYVGTLNQSQASDALVRALGRLNAYVNGKGRNSIRWLAAGRLESQYRSSITSELGESFAFLGYLSHDDARSLMNDSDVLLLMINRVTYADGIVPAKLYEYLASGRPILCLTPVYGEAARIVEKHNAGFIVNIDDEEEIFQALRKLYDAWAIGKPYTGASRDELWQYDRRELTRRLAKIFDECIASRHDKRD